MKRFLACLVITGAALANGGPGGAAAAAPHPAGNIDVLVAGTPQKRYAHQGRWYIEALRGREYAIRLTNPYGVRVAVALSVDGLNTIDAQRSTAADARKWVIEPYGTITISGWQTSRSAARRFEFTTEERSYAQALGQADNLGVISAVFFRERRAQVARPEPREQDRRAAAPPPAAAAPDASAAPEAAARGESNKGTLLDGYAATGMGRQAAHPVTQVWLDLEQTPALSVDIRYEYLPQLIALGILPGPVADPLRRRERSDGFEPGFSPAPPSWR